MKRLAAHTMAPILLPLAVCGSMAAVWGCSQPSQKPPPRLSKFGGQLPKELTAVPPKPASEPEPFQGTVEEAADVGCTTTIVAGLSEQIIAEGNCLKPGTYSRMPELENLEVDASVFPYLQKPARDALVAALTATPDSSMRVTSMLRTLVQQYLLNDWHRRGRCGITLAAQPGKSNHETGLAVDIGNFAAWRQPLRKYRFRWYGQKDRWHFDFVGHKAKKRRGWDVKAFQELWNRNYPDDQIVADGDYGPSTEQRLKHAPAHGFAIGPSCAAEQ